MTRSGRNWSNCCTNPAPATIRSISTGRPNTLFGVLTRPADHTMASLPDHPVMKKWWAHMADIMATNPDNSPVQSDLVTVFHMP